tara:strand:+ start:5465 stop:6112 length:648 start_codon:yes stop_codon:yes gene_type:complete
MIVVNFKNYKFGKVALELAKSIEKNLGKVVVCVNFVDISEIVSNTKLKVFSQHVDLGEIGKGTGFILPEAVEQVGGVGTLLNHSEHRISFREISKTLKRCEEVGLKVIVCVESLREARKVKKLKPYAIALEDKELVGTGKSITEFKVKEVIRFARLLNGSGIGALCGAGINDVNDVRAAYSMGCQGVLISSAIVKGKESGKLLKDLKALRVRRKR